MTFPTWLAEQIRTRGVKKKHVAAAVGVRPATISGWLNGAIPSGDDLAKLRELWQLSGEDTVAMMRSLEER